METSLYDDQGNAITFVTDGPDPIMYRFSGAALAFIAGDAVFAWNGLHLGWYTDGLLFNLKGARIGSIKETCPKATFMDPDKFKKHERTRRMKARDAKPKPALGTAYSEKTFEDFLRGMA